MKKTIFFYFVFISLFFALILIDDLLFYFLSFLLSIIVAFSVFLVTSGVPYFYLTFHEKILDFFYDKEKKIGTNLAIFSITFLFSPFPTEELCNEIILFFIFVPTLLFSKQTTNRTLLKNSLKILFFTCFFKFFLIKIPDLSFREKFFLSQKKITL